MACTVDDHEPLRWRHPGVGGAHLLDGDEDVDECSDVHGRLLGCRDVGPPCGRPADRHVDLRFAERRQHGPTTGRVTDRPDPFGVGQSGEHPTGGTHQVDRVEQDLDVPLRCPRDLTGDERRPTPLDVIRCRHDETPRRDPPQQRRGVEPERTEPVGEQHERERTVGRRRHVAERVGHGDREDVRRGARWQEARGQRRQVVGQRVELAVGGHGRAGRDGRGRVPDLDLTVGERQGGHADGEGARLGEGRVVRPTRSWGHRGREGRRGLVGHSRGLPGLRRRTRCSEDGQGTGRDDDRAEEPGEAGRNGGGLRRSRRAVHPVSLVHERARRPAVRVCEDRRRWGVDHRASSSTGRAADF